MPFSVLTDTQNRLLAEMVRHHVRFVVAGGYAVRFHGHMRPVEDLDLFLDTSEENLERLRLVLESVGAEKLDQIVDHLSRPRTKVTWEDVEFLQRIGNSSFDDVHQQAIRFSFEALELPVMPKLALVEAKRVAIKAEDRGEKLERDKADLQALLGCSQTGD